MKVNAIRCGSFIHFFKKFRDRERQKVQPERLRPEEDKDRYLPLLTQRTSHLSRLHGPGISYLCVLRLFSNRHTQQETRTGRHEKEKTQGKELVTNNFCACLLSYLQKIGHGSREKERSRITSSTTQVRQLVIVPRATDRPHADPLHGPQVDPGDIPAL